MNKINKSRLATALIILSLLVSACGDSSKGGPNAQAPKKPAAKPIPVEVANPQLGVAASYYVTTATVEPSSDAQIFARTSGVVRKIFREEGDDVKAGEILLQLENDDQKLRVKQAEQNLASAQREFNRLSKMRKAGAVSPTEFEAARTNFETAQTELELAQLALSYTQITAPFDGRLVWREVDLGAHVLNGNLLFRVMAIEPLLVRVHIPSARVGKIAKGQTVELDVDAVEETLKGEVELVSPIVDPDTGTVKVTINISGVSAKVRPGDFTKVKLVTDSRQEAKLLPSVALIEERGEYYLFVEENGKAVRKDIKVGYVVDDRTEVVLGVEMDDRVVVKGQRNLNDGNLIKVMDNKKEAVLASKPAAGQNGKSK